MTPSEADLLAQRLTSDWPGWGPQAPTWRRVLGPLDFDTASVAYEHLLRTQTTSPSVADFSANPDGSAAPSPPSRRSPPTSSRP